MDRRQGASRRLEILFAGELLLPATGGAERYVLELLGRFAQRHGVRAVWLARDKPTAAAVRDLPPGVEGAEWRGPRRFVRTRARPERRRRTLSDGVRDALRERPADVIVSQAEAVPVAVAAAEDAGASSVLLLPSYVSLCRHAFVPGSGCRPELGCLACADGSARARRRQRIVAESRAACESAIARATALIAPSDAVADTYERWTGRRAEVVAPVVAAHPPVEASVYGHVAIVAAKWGVAKGTELIGPIARALPDRRVVVTERGLNPRLRRELASLPNVRLAGYVPIGELLSGASVVLVPSQGPEPFCRVAFEALSAGVPVLASAVGGLVEFVPEAELVREYAAPEAWRRAVRSLADPRRWEEARHRGRDAAAAVLATRPLDRIAGVLLRAAS